MTNEATSQTAGPDSTQVVRWSVVEGARPSRYGRWHGERGRDGSLTVYASNSLAGARRGETYQTRALRPEQVEVMGWQKGKPTWSPVVESTNEHEDIADVTSASPVEPSSRDGWHDEIRAGLHEDWLAEVAWRVDSLAIVMPHVDPLVHCLRELVAYASVMTWSGWHPEPVGTASGAELVAALEAARNGVRAQFPELLDAVMITGSGMSSYGVTWGHFRREAWRDALASGRRPEIFIGAERLATGAVLTMQTILHEAAHELAFVRDIQDTSRQHRYHNGKFRKIAEELSLTYVPDDPDPTLGYSAVTLTGEGKRRWRKEIAALHEAVTLMGDDPTRWLLTGSGGGAGGLGGHGLRLPRAPGTPRKGGASYVKAECACPRIIRVSASTLALGDIVCHICGMAFT